MTIDIDDLRAKYEAATRGPWRAARECITCPGEYAAGIVADCRNRDADFIVAAYAAFPELLAMAESAEVKP